MSTWIVIGQICSCLEWHSQSWEVKEAQRKFGSSEFDLIQKETGGTQSLSDSDDYNTVDDSATKCDRLSDTVDGHVHVDKKDNRHANR